EENKEQKEQMDRLKEEHNKQLDQIKNVKKKNEKQKEQINNLNTKNEQQVNQINNLINEKQKLQTQIDNMTEHFKSENGKQRDELYKQQHKMKQLDSDHQQQKIAFNKLEKQCNSLKKHHLFIVFLLLLAHIAIAILEKEKEHKKSNYRLDLTSEIMKQLKSDEKIKGIFKMTFLIINKQTGQKYFQIFQQQFNPSFLQLNLQGKHFINSKLKERIIKENKYFGRFI
ncbi:viral A-type inclusion protein, partial [Reticulomyxa filosa]